MDFVVATAFDGRRLRAPTIVDTCTRERLAIEVRRSLKCSMWSKCWRVLLPRAGTLPPPKLTTYYGNEFISKVVDWCAYEPGIELDFRLSGTPTENVKVESFNGRFRQEGLNARRLLSLAGAQQNK